MKITDTNILKSYKKYSMRIVIGVLLIIAALIAVLGFVKLGQKRLAEEDSLYNIYEKIDKGELHGQCHAAYVDAVGIMMFAKEDGGSECCGLAVDEKDHLYLVRMPEKKVEQFGKKLENGETVRLNGITFKFTDTDLRRMAAAEIGSYVKNEAVTTESIDKYIGPFELRCRDVDLADMTMNLMGIWMFVIIGIIIAGGYIIKDNWFAKTSFERLDPATESAIGREVINSQWFPTIKVYACDTVVMGVYKGLKVFGYKDILMVFRNQYKEFSGSRSSVMIMYKNGIVWEFSRAKLGNESVDEFNRLCEIIKSKNEEVYIGYNADVYMKLRLKGQNNM